MPSKWGYNVGFLILDKEPILLQTFQVENTPCHYVTEQGDLQALSEKLQCEKMLAVDTEFLRTNTFYPIVGLIQIATHDVCYLIDPISCPDLAPLATLLFNPEIRIVMHACSEDLEVFQRTFGRVPQNIFDTQIAASMVARDQQLGLQKLILNYCNKEIPKDETRSDWTKRPLTDNQMTYAALDVVCLLQVYEALVEKLNEKQRLSWVEEESKRMLKPHTRQLDDELYYRGMGDAWKLKGKKLEALQRLSTWREQQARTRDKPRGFIFSDRELFAIADQLPKSINQLSKVSDFKPVQIRKYGAEALGIVEEVLASQQEPLPVVSKPFNNRVKKIAKAIKPEVEKIAVALDMATDRLSNRKYLEKFVKAEVEGSEMPSYFQGWRSATLVPALKQAMVPFQQATSDEES